MNRQQLFILLALVAIVGGVGLHVFKRSTESWQESGASMGQKVLGEFPINDVAQVDITDKQEAVHLALKGEQWTIQERADYPASFQQISGLTRKLWDLKAAQDLGKIGPSQRPRLDLLEPGKGPESGTLIELKDKDGKTIRSLLVGKTYSKESEESPMGGGAYPVGRYVMPLGGQDQVALVSDPLFDVNPKPETWLDKEFFRVERPKSVAVTGTSGALLWKISRETENSDWTLADAKPEEKLDPGKVAAFGSVLSSPSLSDVAKSDLKSDVTGLDHPMTAVLQTFDGFTYTVKIGKLAGDNNYVTVGVTGQITKERTPGKDEKADDKATLDKQFADKVKSLEEKLAREKALDQRVFLVAKFAFDQIQKERSQFLAENKASPSPAPGANSAPSLPVISPAAVTPKSPPVGPTVVAPAAKNSPKSEAVYTAPVSWPPLPAASASPKAGAPKAAPSATAKPQK